MISPADSNGGNQGGFGSSVTASGFAKIFQAGGNQIIYEANAPYRLAPFALAPQILAAEHVARQPSRLLRAQYEVVPFQGRVAELTKLREWRDSSSADTAVMLIHGSGGQGKTRLAARIAQEWSGSGWLALQAFGHDDLSGPASVNLPALDGVAGVLVVADYAERWSTTDLLTLLRDAASPGGRPVRVVLLSRPSGRWWQALAYRFERDRHIDTDAFQLSRLGENAEDREELFIAARDRFALLLGIQHHDILAPPTNLKSDDNYGLVLTIHMAALASVLASPSDGPPPDTLTGLSSFLLARERDAWQLLYQQGRISAADDVMAQAVFAATLTGPLNYDDALTVMSRTKVESESSVGRVVRDHAFCYPPGSPSHVLEPLYPDRLGEDFIALTTPGHSHLAYPADPWAFGALTRLLTADDTENAVIPTWAEPAYQVLEEAATRWPHIAALIGAETLVGRHSGPKRAGRSHVGRRRKADTAVRKRSGRTGPGPSHRGMQ
jgi:hypothetical protein